MFQCLVPYSCYGRESATIPDLEHNVSIPPNSGSREQPKPCVIITTVEGIPEEEEEEEIDMAGQQAETALYYCVGTCNVNLLAINMLCTGSEHMHDYNELSVDIESSY